jgi:hypothetical protein
VKAGNGQDHRHAGAAGELIAEAVRRRVIESRQSNAVQHHTDCLGGHAQSIVEPRCDMLRYGNVAIHR